MRIGIANDHGGVELKNELVKYLESLGHSVINYGCDTEDVVDAIDYAEKACRDFINKKTDTAILICKTGVAMSVAANKIKGVRCAKIDNVVQAAQCKVHDDSNVITLASFNGIDENKKIVKAYLDAEFSRLERYVRRLKKLEELEEKENNK